MTSSDPKRPDRASALTRILRSWFDSRDPVRGSEPDRIDWLRIAPFLGIHLGAAAAIWVGVSWAAVALCLATYVVRMFGVTAFYHRYFAHRSFRTSRAVQFLGAALGNAAGQRGPLWWAAHHRKHHKFADTERDLHSPKHAGVMWCHSGWWATDRAHATDFAQVRDLTKYPELVWLDRFDTVAPIAFAALVTAFGAICEALVPQLGLTMSQALVWGFFVSTVLLYHATFTINSLCHMFGSRRYATRDDSRNNVWLALITLGEGWHNNHHHYPVAARQGFFWWEIDVSYYALRLLAKLGLVSDLREVPAEVKAPATPIKEAA